jgi:hypothetical protein
VNEGEECDEFLKAVECPADNDFVRCHLDDGKRVFRQKLFRAGRKCDAGCRQPRPKTQLTRTTRLLTRPVHDSPTASVITALSCATEHTRPRSKSNARRTSTAHRATRRDRVRIDKAGRANRASAQEFRGKADGSLSPQPRNPRPPLHATMMLYLCGMFCSGGPFVIIIGPSVQSGTDDLQNCLT